MQTEYWGNQVDWVPVCKPCRDSIVAAVELTPTDCSVIIVMPSGNRSNTFIPEMWLNILWGSISFWNRCGTIHRNISFLFIRDKTNEWESVCVQYFLCGFDCFDYATYSHNHSWSDNRNSWAASLFRLMTLLENYYWDDLYNGTSRDLSHHSPGRAEMDGTRYKMHRHRIEPRNSLANCI
jgi:hypothetical protein